MFGALPSPLGSVATFLSFPLKEQLVPGAPKQFAASIGFFMSGFSTILFFNEEIVGGSVVIGVLMGFAALEGFLNFCFGCYIYGWLNAFGLVPNDVYKPYTDSLGFIQAGLNDINTRLGWQRANDFVVPGSMPGKAGEHWGWREKYAGKPIPLPVVVNVATPEGQQSSSPLDFTYKMPSTDDTFREKWSAAYVQFSDFSVVLGIAGFALAVRTATESATLWVQPELWQFFAIMGAAVYGLLLLALLFKIVTRPRKVLSDLRHPVKRNSLAVLPICNLLFSALAFNHDKWLQSTMWWAGAPFVFAHLLVVLAALIKNHHSADHLTPDLILPAAGNMVAAVVTPLMAVAQPWTGSSFTEASYWFFGVGFLFFILLLATTLFHSFSYHWADERGRPMIMLWAGACFIASLSWMVVSKQTKFDGFAYIFFTSGTMLVLVAVYLGLSGWLITGRFELGMWAISFPLDVAAMSACGYYNSQLNAWSQGIFWLFIAGAGWANYVLLFHTLHALCMRRFPQPSAKFGPLALNKLQHDGFREMIKKLNQECSMEDVHDPAATSDETNRQNKLSRIQSLLNPLLHTLQTHADYEDNVMIPELASHFPEQVRPEAKQHEDVHAREEAVKKLLADGHLDALLPAVRELTVLLERHFQAEEDYWGPILKKYLNSGIQLQIVREMWRTTSLEDLENSIVTIARHLPFHAKRLRYLKSFTWAFPDRAQQIGLWLHRGFAKDPLGDIKYAYIVDAMPELAPRNSGFKWVRYV